MKDIINTSFILEIREICNLMYKKGWNERNDPFSFEKYCGVCIFFKTHDCPYFDKVLSDTEWAKIHCDKFYD